MEIKIIRSSTIEGVLYNFSPYRPNIGDFTEYEYYIWKCVDYGWEGNKEFFELERKNIRRKVYFELGEFVYLETVIP
jgi:hypothetical protein